MQETRIAQPGGSCHWHAAELSLMITPLIRLQGQQRGNSSSDSGSWSRSPRDLCSPSCMERSDGWTDILEGSLLCPNQSACLHEILTAPCK